jgi:hypothetical protein
MRVGECVLLGPGKYSVEVFANMSSTDSESVTSSARNLLVSWNDVRSSPASGRQLFRLMKRVHALQCGIAGALNDLTQVLYAMAV